MIKEFWTSFGQYMRPVRNSAGEITNWLNYKTGIKHIYFRMDASSGQAAIAIELHHPDVELRQEYFEKFEQLKTVLQQETGEEWSWERNAKDENGKIFSRIGAVMKQVSVFDRNDWPAIISFLNPRIIALDNFWNLVKDGFQ